MEIENIKIENYMEDILSSISEIVQIKSVKGEAKPEMPFGEGPTLALKKGLEIAEKLGFRVVNIDNKVGYAEIGEGKELIGILGHLDVVPEGDLKKWSVPPYSGIIKDGYIWGRGVSDNKGPVITSLYAIRALLDGGFKPDKRIRVIMGADEESGFGCMERYLKTEEKVTVGFTPDATFPGIHGEKGILQIHLFKKDNFIDSERKFISLKGGGAVNSVPDSCKTTIKFSENIQETTFETFGKAAHGAEPEKGVNAVSHLMYLLEKSGIKSDFINFYNKYINFETDGKSFGIKVEDSYGKLSLNLGVAEYENGEGILKLDIRYPITANGDDIIFRLQEIAKKEGFTLKVAGHKKAIYFDLELPFIKALGEAYSSVTGDYISKPVTIGGGTYARAMENIIAFGGCFPNDPEFAHQPDERVKIENIRKQGDIYIRAIYNLSKGVYAK